MEPDDLAIQGSNTYLQLKLLLISDCCWILVGYLVLIHEDSKDRVYHCRVWHWSPTVAAEKHLYLRFLQLAV
jgi:hypothetical protein